MCLHTCHALLIVIEENAAELVQSVLGNSMMELVGKRATRTAQLIDSHLCSVALSLLTLRVASDLMELMYAKHGCGWMTTYVLCVCVCVCDVSVRLIQLVYHS